MPANLFDRNGTTSLIVFDEIQDVLAVPGADGKIRSVIRTGRGRDVRVCGSAPGMMASSSPSPRGRCSSRRSPGSLSPLPIDDVGDYVSAALRADGADAARR